ncbi:beta-lactamase family protein [Paenibacillus alvei]|uniref:beta-lactamase family protein n=1 Tax=Paenibacillus alvei TaxID=44250 RepID=UPI002281655A|nr:beta-lactamase family protein [Paenibacillus alvei]MCY7482977.1 beta-lactamase family protein [Paenibacillus alvei]
MQRSSVHSSASPHMNRRVRKLFLILSLAVALATVSSVHAADAQSAQVNPNVSQSASSKISTIPTTLTNGPSDPKEIESFADQLFALPSLQKLPGAVFVVVKNGQILLSKGYGYADVKTKKPMDPDTTVLRFASVTKPFASAALLQLAEQGKLDVKKDISAYLGDLTIPRKVDGALTAEHLMTHTSGFDYPEASDDLSITSNADYVRKHMPTVVRKPGTSYSYDNFGFKLQGYLVERITGVPFYEYGMKHILQPLGMTHSSFIMTPEAKKNLATSYTGTGEMIPYYEVSPADGPDGSLVSTGSDMAKFMIALLNGGTYKGQRILHSDTVHEMMKIRVSAHPKVPNTTYGFESLYHESFNGQHIIGKGGNLPGFGSFIWLMPERNVGFMVIYNRNEDSKEDFRNIVFRSFMNHYYPDQRPVPAETTLDKDTVKKLVGEYRDLRIGFHSIRITVQSDGKIKLIDSINGNSQSLSQIDPLLFRTEKGKYVAFKQNDIGEISYMDYNNVAWYEKLSLPDIRYTDVGTDHPYRSYIQDIVMRSGDTEHKGLFRPASPITRAEFVSMFMKCLRMQPSQHPSSFSDMKGHWAEKDVQAAHKAGLVSGSSGQYFNPDQPIQRQEAAMIAWRFAKYLGSPPQQVKLAGDTDAWAIDGVKYAVAMRKYGPEIITDADSSIDYESKRSMLRQEAAALISTIFKQAISF